MRKSSSSSSGDFVHEVKIDLVPDKTIAAINFVLKVLIFSIWQLRMSAIPLWSLINDHSRF